MWIIIVKGYEHISQYLNEYFQVHDTSVELITTGDFMSRFCGMLALAREVQKGATQIAKKASDLDIVPGRSPISVAAAAIYMASQASDDKRTQREIADVVGVANVTISQCYTLMLPRAAELFPSDFRFTTSIIYQQVAPCEECTPEIWLPTADFDQDQAAVSSRFLFVHCGGVLTDVRAMLVACPPAIVVSEYPISSSN